MIDLFASVVPISISLILLIVWMLMGRAYFFYHMPMDTKRNRLLALTTGPLFGIVYKYFNHWLAEE